MDSQLAAGAPCQGRPLGRRLRRSPTLDRSAPVRVLLIMHIDGLCRTCRFSYPLVTKARRFFGLCRPRCCTLLQFGLPRADRCECFCDGCRRGAGVEYAAAEILEFLLRYREALHVRDGESRHLHSLMIDEADRGLAGRQMAQRGSGHVPDSLKTMNGRRPLFIDWL